ncbi:hypothetical protein [Nitrosopumilus sp.]|uniref:hypothetical protein n=1 Tax=Nitrosopumilus sp. TaxID=2024843 RepID=UPI0034A01E67
MAEIALTGSLISALGSTIPSLLQKLSELNVTTRQGVTVFYKSCEIEFVFHFNMGSMTSRLNSIIKPLQKFLVKPIELDHVIDISGYTLTGDNDLKKLGIIQTEKDKATINFGKLLELNSDLVILTVRKKLNPKIPEALLSLHIDQNPEYVGKLTSANIELALDYGNLWYNDFDHFNVRDIEFSFGLTIDLPTIINALSPLQRKKIINAGKAFSQGNRDAISYLRIFSENFLKFQSDELESDLLDCVSMEPENNFHVLSIHPKMQSAEIASVGHPIVLPGEMKIFVECRLEGKDMVLKGKITIDLEKFSKVLRKITSSIEQQTGGLKFK